MCQLKLCAAELTPEKRPARPTPGWGRPSLRTMEHGGEYPDTKPQAIKLIDAEGRSCIYVPMARSNASNVTSITYNFIGPGILFSVSCTV
jgi:hypothetical protein